MTTYCPQGHRITHESAIPPATCPTCGASTKPPVVSIAATRPAAATPAPKQRWPDREAPLADDNRPMAATHGVHSPASDEEILGDDFSFEGRPRVTRDADRPPTIAELQQGGNPVERTEGRAPVLPDGGDNGGQVSTADLVAQMTREAATNGELPTTAPRAQVARGSAQPKRARAAERRAAKPRPVRIASGGANVHGGAPGGSA